MAEVTTELTPVNAPKRSKLWVRILIAILLLVAVGGLFLLFSRPAYSVSVKADGKTTVITTKARDPLSVAEEAKVVLGPDDYLDTSSFKAGKRDGNVLTVYRAFPVEVTADHKTQTIQFAYGTVQDVLKKAGIVLADSDTVSPSLTAKVRKPSEITVTRIRFQEHKKLESVPFRTVTVESAYMKAGEKKVEQEGKNGTKQITYKDKVVDGEVVETTKVSETVTVKPVLKVITEGSRIVQSYTAANVPKQAVAVINGYATAYTSKPGALTASGLPAAVGRVAVNPKQIPYGSELFIVAEDGHTYGYAIAADTGGFVKMGNAIIDLYYNSEQQCRDWGHRKVNIYVLKWGTGKIG